MKKLFVGWRDQSGCCRVHTTQGKRSDPLPPRNDVWNHSPDGFEWGYAGSGPAQLALAILLHVTQSEAIACTLHQKFKRQFIAPLAEGGWQIPEADVLLWLWQQFEDRLAPMQIRLGREAFYDA